VPERLICRYCRKSIDPYRDNFVMAREDQGAYDSRYLSAHLDCYEEHASPETRVGDSPPR
jgi:hypothetical protein